MMMAMPTKEVSRLCWPYVDWRLQIRRNLNRTTSGGIKFDSDPLESI